MKTYKIRWHLHGCLSLPANSEDEAANKFEELSPEKILRRSAIGSDYDVKELNDGSKIKYSALNSEAKTWANCYGEHNE